MGRIHLTYNYFTDKCLIEKRFSDKIISPTVHTVSFEYHNKIKYKVFKKIYIYNINNIIKKKILKNVIIFKMILNYFG